MLSVTVAAVVATVLCLLIRSLRPLGAVGTFVLVALDPIVFGGLVLLAGLVYLLFFRRSDYEVIPKGRMLPPDDASRRRRTLGVLLLVGGTAGVLALTYAPPTDEGSYVATMGETRSAPSEAVIVLRTPEGLLEVARIDAVEVLDARITHSILGVKIGETAPRIRVPAVFRYQIELAEDLRVLRSNGVFTVVAPVLKPALPVGVDFAGMEKDVAGTWLLLGITGDEDIDALERTITAKLAQKASSRDYRERAREAARTTIREFVRTWLVEQSRFESVDHTSIRIFFADEPVRSIEALSG